MELREASEEAGGSDPRGDGAGAGGQAATGSGLPRCEGGSGVLGAWQVSSQSSRERGERQREGGGRLLPRPRNCLPGGGLGGGLAHIPEPGWDISGSPGP